MTVHHEETPLPFHSWTSASITIVTVMVWLGGCGAIPPRSGAMDASAAAAAAESLDDTPESVCVPYAIRYAEGGIYVDVLIVAPDEATARGRAEFAFIHVTGDPNSWLAASREDGQRVTLAPRRSGGPLLPFPWLTGTTYEAICDVVPLAERTADGRFAVAVDLPIRASGVHIGDILTLEWKGNQLGRLRLAQSGDRFEVRRNQAPPR